VRAGKRLHATKSGFTSMTAASKARAEALETLRRAPNAAKRGQTLADFLDAWLVRRTEGSRALRPSTANDYRRYVTVIKEAIGGERLRDVTADTLDDLERHLRKVSPNATTAHARCFAVLQSALRDAYRRGMILDDPTRRREAVRAPKRRKRMLQPEEFARLHAWATARGDRMADVLWVSATTAMRRGELAGLRWVDVDLERGRIEVEQNAVQVGSAVHVGRVKTASGEGRIVVMDAVTIDALRRVRAQQEADQAAWGAAYAGDGMLVFTAADGTPYKPEVFTRALPRMIATFNRELRVRTLTIGDPELDRLEKSRGMGAKRLALIRSDVTLVDAPLPIVTFHSLRHLGASIMLASGGTLASVQRRLGHSSITVTSDLYGHQLEQVARLEVEAAAGLLSTRSESVS
jgi:integrase